MTAAVLPNVGATISTPIAALLVLTPIALGEALSTLPDAMRALARSQASAVRLRTLPDQEPAVGACGVHPLDTKAGIPSSISVSELTTSWGGAAPPVGPMDLQVEPGTRLAITGPNGSG